MAMDNFAENVRDKSPPVTDPEALAAALSNVGTMSPRLRKLYDDAAALLRAQPAQKPWQPMRTAPKDGIAVLVLTEGSDIPKGVRWLDADDKRAVEGAGWYMTWDGYCLTAADGPRYWMHCPPDPDEAEASALRQERDVPVACACPCCLQGIEAPHEYHLERRPMALGPNV